MNEVGMFFTELALWTVRAMIMAGVMVIGFALGRRCERDEWISHRRSEIARDMRRVNAARAAIAPRVDEEAAQRAAQRAEVERLRANLAKRNGGCP